MAEVTLTKLNKYFDTTHVVKDVDLTIRDKEFMVFVGPSGCGKTTTLRMIAGLEAVSSGDIRIENTVVNQVPPMDRDIAMVFQNYALYPHMSVASNMAFGLKMRKFPKDEIQSRIKRAATILGIENLLARKPRQLSGGQRQRVALGRAIVRDPKVFLFDEPLSNLDAKLRVQMRVELKKLHERLAVTSIYVTHDQVEAMTLGDRVVVMKDGVVQQVGEPLELYNQPANRFVAGFIGSPAMSFVRAGELPGVPTDGDLLVGVRPEHARPWADEAGLIGPLEGGVEYAEALGRETFLGVRGDGGPRLVVCVDGRSGAQPGDRVTYGLVPAGLRYFDPQTGDAVEIQR
jgi:multiple sugar transport system ATP-binding protein